MVATEAMGGRRENDSDESHEAKVGELGRAYAAAVLTGDEVAAERAIREAIDARLSAAEIDDEIIAPALWLVGQLWERGEISIADEHLATEISMRVLALQREAERVVRARRDNRVMLAAPAGELHVVALRMIGDLLRDAGYDVMMLGADVPAGALAASATRHQPDVICLSSTMPRSGDQALISSHEVQRQWPTAGFVLGGRGLTSRVRSRPGVDVCDRVSDAIDAVDAMVKRADRN
jgi:methanogenic corrinoid protein MtbC1